jgi:Na+/melibiose symporter-like transporter
MQPARLVLLILAGLLVWGGMLALGAYLNNASGWAGAVVAACSLTFIGFWGLLLAARQRRLRRAEQSESSGRQPGNGSQ